MAACHNSIECFPTPPSSSNTPPSKQYPGMICSFYRYRFRHRSTTAWNDCTSRIRAPEIIYLLTFELTHSTYDEIRNAWQSEPHKQAHFNCYFYPNSLALSSLLLEGKVYPLARLLPTEPSILQHTFFLIDHELSQYGYWCRIVNVQTVLSLLYRH